jgi:hypothetical protein
VVPSLSVCVGMLITVGPFLDCVVPPALRMPRAAINRTAASPRAAKADTIFLGLFPGADGRPSEHV